MLYPVAPLKLSSLTKKLNAASDAEGLPRPTIRRPEGTDEELLEAVCLHLGSVTPADPEDDAFAYTFPEDDAFAFTFREGVYLAVEVKWPEPLRTAEGEMVLFTGNAPVGPDPLAMWQAMFLLTPVPQ